MALPKSVCPAATTVALMTGKNGAAFSSVAAAASPRLPVSAYRRRRGIGTENAPTTSSSRVTLGIFGLSLTASHASVSVSGTGPIVGIILDEGTMARLVTKTPGVVGRGICEGISNIPPSDVGLSALGTKADVDAS